MCPSARRGAGGPGFGRIMRASFGAPPCFLVAPWFCCWAVPDIAPSHNMASGSVTVEIEVARGCLIIESLIASFKILWMRRFGPRLSRTPFSQSLFPRLSIQNGPNHHISLARQISHLRIPSLGGSVKLPERCPSIRTRLRAETAEPEHKPDERCTRTTFQILSLFYCAR